MKVYQILKKVSVKKQTFLWTLTLEHAHTANFRRCVLQTTDNVPLLMFGTRQNITRKTDTLPWCIKPYSWEMKVAKEGSKDLGKDDSEMYRMISSV
jgi:hypothetical protein